MASSRNSNVNFSEESDGGKCYCGVPCARLVSWTEKNPGRRFKRCKFESGRDDGLGCGYWRWVDQGCLAWQRDVINQLLEENRALRLELGNLKGRLSAVEGCQLKATVY